MFTEKLYLVGGLEHFLSFLYIGSYIGNNHPNWRTHIFQRGRYTTNQVILDGKTMVSRRFPFKPQWKIARKLRLSVEDASAARAARVHAPRNHPVPCVFWGMVGWGNGCKCAMFHVQMRLPAIKNSSGPSDPSGVFIWTARVWSKFRFCLSIFRHPGGFGFCLGCVFRRPAGCVAAKWRRVRDCRVSRAWS